MTARRVPIIPTIIVAVAVATMIGLGVWQLGRMQEKAELLAYYEAASQSSGKADYPLTGAGNEVWFLESKLNCLGITNREAVAGTSLKGQKGWIHRVTCADGAVVDLGFSRNTVSPEWTGGEVSGVIAPGPRLVADPPAAGLEPMARPDPRDLPNNHLAYAGQWFFFALTALVIYVLALRRKRR